MAKYLIAFYLLFNGILSYAQQSQENSIFSGTVINENKNKIEFATVILINKADSANISQVVLTDTLGSFSFKNIKSGEYKFEVKALGYSTYSEKYQIINFEINRPQLKKIILYSAPKKLNEVVIVGERPAVERARGIIILNTSNSFFKTAPNALEILRKAPGLHVDQVGGITIRPGIVPTVYINGKQIPVSSEELQNLQSDDIEQIEIIPNANAKYDGVTNSVINIKLKRDKNLGLRGNMYYGAALNRHYAGYELGSSLTYKAPKWSYYLRAGYYQSNRFLQSNEFRDLYIDSQNTSFQSFSFTKFQAKPFSYQASIDYAINKRSLVTLTVQGILNKRNDLTENSTYAVSAVNSTSVSSTTSSPSNNNNISIDLNYSSEFANKKAKIELAANNLHYVTHQTQDFRVAFSDKSQNSTHFPTALLGNFPSTTNISTARVDLSYKLDKHTSLAVGAKYSKTDTNNSLIYDSLSINNVRSSDLSRTNEFTYSEKISAAYTSFTYERERSSAEVGLRIEDTNSFGSSQTTSQTVARQYLNWLPSFQYSYKLKNNQSISFTFSRKLLRPSFYDLNPFQFYLSPYEYTQGNPFLLPTKRNRGELNYLIKNISITASYSLNTDVIAQLPVQDFKTGIIYYTRANLDMSQLALLELTSPTKINNWWKMQNTFSLYQSRIRSSFNGDSFDNKMISYSLEGQQVFSPLKNLVLELNYQYNGPTVNQFYVNKSNYTLSLGISKSILQGKGNIRLSAVDLFNTYRENYSGRLNGVDITVMQKRSVQQISFRFTYNFGKSTFKRSSQTSSSSEEEKRAR